MTESVACIARPPQSENIEIGEQAKVVSFERVPRDLITEVVVNSCARQWLHPSLQYLASAEWISSQVMMTVPPTVDGQSVERVLVPRDFKRGVSLAHGTIPFADRFVGGMIMGKGCSVSGHDYCSDHGLDQSSYSRSPWGFFGNRDAEKEIRVSNILISHGLRSSLPLGFCRLNANKLRSWLVSKWSSFRSSVFSHRIETNMDILLANGDDFVFFVRVGGVAQRIKKVINGDEPCEMNRRWAMRRKADIKKAAGLFLTEIEVFPTAFVRYLVGIDKASLIDVLSKVTQGTYLTEKELGIYLSLLKNMIITDIRAVQGLPKKFKDEFPNFPYIIPDSKDIDVAHFHYDYEQAREYNPFLEKWDINDYLSGLDCYLADYFREVAGYLTSTDSQTIMISDRKLLAELKARI